MKYISLLHLRGITLSLVRRNVSEGASFLYITSLPAPLVETQLFPNESNGVSIMSHLVRHLWNMAAPAARSMAPSSISLQPKEQSILLKTKLKNGDEGSVLRSHLWEKDDFFFPLFLSPHWCIKKKISCFLTVFCLGMSRGVLPAQQWPQDREALEESAKTHTAARLGLRRQSGGSLWPSLSLCKNQWCVM